MNIPPPLLVGEKEKERWHEICSLPTFLLTPVIGLLSSLVSSPLPCLALSAAADVQKNFVHRR